MSSQFLPVRRATPEVIFLSVWVIPAWLYLHIDGNPTIDQHQQVFAGDTVNFQGYSLYVEQISAGGIGCAPGASTGDVHLIIRQP